MSYVLCYDQYDQWFAPNKVWPTWPDNGHILTCTMSRNKSGMNLTLCYKQPAINQSNKLFIQPINQSTILQREAKFFKSVLISNIHVCSNSQAPNIFLVDAGTEYTIMNILAAHSYGTIQIDNTKNLICYCLNQFQPHRNNVDIFIWY